METLRLLANCVKHEPMGVPDEELLKLLNLPLKPEGRLIVGYMPIPESSCFREGLAQSVNLPKDVDYCSIAETFVDLANQFLKDVERKTSLAHVTGRVSLTEFAC